MKKLLTVISLATALFVLPAQAEEVEVTGTGTCSKCDLGTAPACQNVILLDDKVIDLTGPISKRFHRYLCQESAEIWVKGEKSEDGKSIEVAEIKKVD